MVASSKEKLASPETERLAYSVPHAATQIDVCTRTAWELIKRKRLRSIRIGRRVLVTRAELIRFLRDGGAGGRE
jgi:excisionase family DNA binding protein